MPKLGQKKGASPQNRKRTHALLRYQHGISLRGFGRALPTEDTRPCRDNARQSAELGGATGLRRVRFRQ